MGKIILSAAKQTLRPSLPILEPLINFEALLKTNSTAQRFICHCEDGADQFIGSVYNSNQDVIVLVGPEGDFSSSEISNSLLAGFKEVNLGDFRLRTETAAIASCIILQTIKILNDKQIFYTNCFTIHSFLFGFFYRSTQY